MPSVLTSGGYRSAMSRKLLAKRTRATRTPKGTEATTGFQGQGLLSAPRKPPETLSGPQIVKTTILPHGAILQVERPARVKDREDEARPRDPEHVRRPDERKASPASPARAKRESPFEQEGAGDMSPAGSGMGPVERRGRVGPVNPLSGVEVIIQHVARGVDEDDAQNDHRVPAPVEGPKVAPLGGQERARWSPRWPTSKRTTAAWR